MIKKPRGFSRFMIRTTHFFKAQYKECAAQLALFRKLWQPFRVYKKFFAGLSMLSIACLTIFYFIQKPIKKLPIFQPNMVNFILVDSSIQHIGRFHKIADFSLTNQNGQTITHNDYKGKIFVADFFFTTCPGICSTMTKNMHFLQTALLTDPEVLLISHSVTPEIDSVSQLKKYAINNGVIDAKWNLLTGDKKTIYQLARQSYLVAEKDENPFDLIHTENFVLIDKKRLIRGYYDGTDLKAMKRLLKDIEILKKE